MTGSEHGLDAAGLAAGFGGLRLAVAGDLIADRYLYARPRRLSREAPVMVLEEERERLGAGGAANVARNLRALGATVSVFGVLGADVSGRELACLLADEGVDVAGVAHVPGRRTPTKTRVLAAEPRRWPSQVLRIDREPEGPVPDAVRAAVADALRARAGELDGLVLSDYGYGLLGPELGAAARALEAAGAACVLDPRRRLTGLHGLTAATPNVGEVAGFTGRDPRELDDPRALHAAAREVLEEARCRYLLVTRGNLGMALFGREPEDALPAGGACVAASGTGEVTDVCGAGDTAAAVFALALARARAPGAAQALDAMTLANAASGVVVMEHGAAVCPPAELERALAHAPRPVLLQPGVPQPGALHPGAPGGRKEPV